MKTTIFISGQKCEHFGFVLCLVFLQVLVLLIFAHLKCAYCTFCLSSLKSIFLWIKCPNSYEYITPQYFLFLCFVLNRAHCLIARFVVIVVTDPQP